MHQARNLDARHLARRRRRCSGHHQPQSCWASSPRRRRRPGRQAQAVEGARGCDVTWQGKGPASVRAAMR
jgi:hypothetical protein